MRMDIREREPPLLPADGGSVRVGTDEDRTVKLQFLGAARQVTGSQYYLEADGAHLLIDCGMYQERAYLARNWDPSPLRPRESGRDVC